MDAQNTTQLIKIIEGGEAAVMSVSEHLKRAGIETTVDLVEDCKPGS